MKQEAIVVTAVGVSVGVGITLKSFMSEFYYVMGKTMSGELSGMWTGLVHNPTM